MKGWRIFAILPLAFLLVSCGLPTGNERPDDQKLRDGINLLINGFTASHPKLINWEAAAVKSQLGAKLPPGKATEAGWTLIWSNATNAELSRVVIPWTILGQYPSKYAPDSQNYTGSKVVPDSIATQIRSLQFGGDPYFGAVVNLRFSTKDSSWIIFTTIPYLPITDDAYGWAHLQNQKWKIVDFGTATVGCAIVPTAIQSEFGFTCPPTETKKM
jgi:hypothetical protein